MKTIAITILCALSISFTVNAADIKSVHEGRISTIRAAAEIQKTENLIERAREGQKQMSLKLTELKDQLINDVSVELNLSLTEVQIDNEKSNSLSFYTSFVGGVTCSNVIIVSLNDISRGYAKCTDGTTEFNINKSY